VRIVGIADQRPHHRAALVGDQLLQIGVAVIGGRFKIAAERGLGIADEGRKIQTAVELDQERAIIGDQLGKQRHREQDQEDPERPVAPAIGFEVLPAAAVERRWAEAMVRHRCDLAERRLHRGFDRLRRNEGHQTSRASKSILGSIHM
jgi:hypothetical protein